MTFTDFLIGGLLVDLGVTIAVYGWFQARKAARHRRILARLHAR